MKIHSTINALLQSSLAFMLLLMTSSFIPSSSDLQEFRINVKNTGKGLELVGLKGSAWKNLSFTINNYHPKAIDEYGMTALKKPAFKDSKLADFLFTITKTKDGIRLEGIKGTAWKELTFTLATGKSQTFDQMGMTE